ncbi:unnamed protein product [Ectocarpus sp. CCAP 1310/34]|nr:unnamed protein product [Ectocarpus sp. CCAP 1310/34]
MRGEERVVRQQRKKHIRGIQISQLLTKVITEAAGKPVQSVVADEVELLEKGKEHVGGIRERASKRGKRQPADAVAASSAAAKQAKRKGADAALSDPLALAHDGGTRSGATPATSREEAHCNSSIGWTTYYTALAVAARAGEHTCTDTDVCHPGQRCKPVESGGVSLAERTNSLGIRHETSSDARRRMHNTNHDIAHKIAASEGCYVYNERKTRSDVTNPGNRGGAGGGAGYLKSCVGY